MQEFDTENIRQKMFFMYLHTNNAQKIVTFDKYFH